MANNYAAVYQSEHVRPRLLTPAHSLVIIISTSSGQRFDGIYIIFCFVVDHYYTRLGRCSPFMLLSRNYFPLVSPSLCLGRSHPVGVDRLWHEERRNQTPINQQMSDIHHRSKLFSVRQKWRFPFLWCPHQAHEQSWTATSTNFRVLIQHRSAFIANWHSFGDVNVFFPCFSSPGSRR